MPDDAPRLLITDLDNTLWDWFAAWYESFSALLGELESLSGVERSVLESQIKVVHQRRGTTEYSNLIREVPCLVEAAAPRDPFEVFDAALHAQNSRRVAATRLYPGVAESLCALKDAGVRVVGYTESGAYWTEWRIRHTGLDGVIDVLYSSPDHDVAAGIDPADLRTGHYDESKYGLRVTRHHHVPAGVSKPDRQILSTILREEGSDPTKAAYIGDSLMKDIAMAQSVGVLDIHAQYGLVQHREEYELLRRVTHWSDQAVAREIELGSPDRDIFPKLTCRAQFGELLPVFGLAMVGDK